MVIGIIKQKNVKLKIKEYNLTMKKKHVE